LFAFIFLFPYFVAFMKVIFEWLRLYVIL
jgi:hypothetical protein